MLDMSTATTDRNLLERVERAAAERAAEEQAAVAAAAKAAAVAQQARRDEAMRQTEQTLIQIRETATSLTVSAREWRRNVEELRRLENALQRTVTPHASERQSSGFTFLSGLALPSELDSLVGDPTMTKPVDLEVVIKGRIANAARFARSVLTPST